MFAVQVSAIASLNARLFGATSLQQLRNNYCVVTVLAFGGFVPITFVLLELRRLHQNSWYMLVISALTVAMSAATFHTASKSKLAAMDLSPLQGTSYMGCGLANPVGFCLNHGCRQYASDNGLGQRCAFMLSLGVILVLFMEHCQVHKWPRISRISMACQSRFSTSGREMFFSCLSFIVITFHFLIFGRYLKDLTVFARYSIGNSSHPHYGAVEIFNSLEWSFGQIMALVVWMPPIAEYIVMELGKFNPGDTDHIED